MHKHKTRTEMNQTSIAHFKVEVAVETITCPLHRPRYYVIHKAVIAETRVYVTRLLSE